MTLSFILVAIALLTAISLFLIARSHRPTTRDLNDLTAGIQPVDLEAFQNLMNPREERFLSENLAHRTFRRIQRRRLVAAIAYLVTVAGNAAILMRIGELAQNSDNDEIVSAGRELGEAASHLRIYCILLLAKLSVAIVIPGMRFSPVGITDSYRDLRSRLGQLSRLQVGSGAPKITATL